MGTVTGGLDDYYIGDESEERNPIPAPRRLPAADGSVIVGDNNYVDESCTSYIISGNNIHVGPQCQNISVLNSSGVIIAPGVQFASVLNSSGVIIEAGLKFATIFNSSGVTVVADNEMWQGNQQLSFADGHSESMQRVGSRILSANVLLLNSNPVMLLGPPGDGKIYDIISAIVHVDFATTAYTGNTVLEIYNQSAVGYIAASAVFNPPLAATANVKRYLKKNEDQFGSSSEQQLIGNDAVYVRTRSGNPSSGDSDIVIYLTYRVITL